jgi:DNA-directed RNA polymerase specialized sigma24 family protein
MAGEITSSAKQSLSGLRAAPQRSELFDAWFSRSREILRFLASRVLGSAEQAEVAVYNCWLTASQDPPAFEREGAFRSWLARVLITEAVAMLRETRDDVFQRRPETHSAPAASAANALPSCQD